MVYPCSLNCDKFLSRCLWGHVTTRYYPYPWNCQTLLFSKKLDSFGSETKRLFVGIIMFYRYFFFSVLTKKLASRSFFYRMHHSGKMEKHSSPLRISKQTFTLLILVFSFEFPNWFLNSKFYSDKSLEH